VSSTRKGKGTTPQEERGSPASEEAQKGSRRGLSLGSCSSSSGFEEYAAVEDMAVESRRWKRRGNELVEIV